MTTKEALFKYILRFADSSLILSQRLSEWTGHGPFLEEDLAATNITLDLLGQAKALLEYAAKVEGAKRSEDDLAFLRNEREFYNTLIVEQENGDYAKTMVRQFLVDAFNFHFYQALAQSKDNTLAALGTKSTKEITYHLRHSSSWLERFGDGTEESHLRAQTALDELWRFTEEMFEMNETDAILLKEGIAVDLLVIQKKWKQTVEEIIQKSTLKVPQNVFMQRGSRDAKHTEYLGPLLAEMQYMQRMHPNAKW